MNEANRAGKTSGRTATFVMVFEMTGGLAGGVRHEAFEVEVTREERITAIRLRGAMPSPSLEDFDEILGRIKGFGGEPLRVGEALFPMIETMVGTAIEELGTVFLPPPPAFVVDPLAGHYPCGSFARYGRHYRLIGGAGPGVMELARRNRTRHPDAPPATFAADNTTIELS